MSHELYCQCATCRARQGLVKCVECGRSFDLLDAEDAEEWAEGHDCEGDAWANLSAGFRSMFKGL